MNTALLLRAVKQGEGGTCALTAHSISLRDLAALAAMILPTVALVAFISFWFWDRNISYMSLFFPAPYNSR